MIPRLRHPSHDFRELRLSLNVFAKPHGRILRLAWTPTRWQSAKAAALQPETSLDPQPQSPITFYRRPLSDSLTSFTSARGKQLFRESLGEGYAENYFSLVGNFTTQSEPAFCGLGSLAMVLNALEMDPGKQWKGVWRWYTDDNLECCASDLDSIKQSGITFREFGCLARCNGLDVVSKRADTTPEFVSSLRSSKEEFIHDLKYVCSRSDIHMVVSFNRKALKQTGDGHFSPIGSYNADKNMALVLDTARFKYPSYFAPVDMLWDSMQPVDRDTGLPRGYFILRRDETVQRYRKPLALCRLTKSLALSNPKLARLFCHVLPEKIQNLATPSLDSVIREILGAVPAEYSALIRINESRLVDLAGEEANGLEEERRRDLKRLLHETRNNPLFSIVHSAISSIQLNSSQSSAFNINQLAREVGMSPQDINTSLATIFILACPREVYRTIPEYLLSQLDQGREQKRMSTLLRSEVQRISDQLSSLMNDYCQLSVTIEKRRL